MLSSRWSLAIFQCVHSMFRHHSWAQAWHYYSVGLCRATPFHRTRRLNILLFNGNSIIYCVRTLCERDTPEQFGFLAQRYTLHAFLRANATTSIKILQSLILRRLCKLNFIWIVIKLNVRFKISDKEQLYSLGAVCSGLFVNNSKFIQREKDTAMSVSERTRVRKKKKLHVANLGAQTKWESFEMR